jgi:hypothetical protein
MNKMKKNFWIMAFVSLFTVVALCSCDKDENEKEEEEIPTSVIANNTLTVTVENGNSYNDKIDTVKACQEGDPIESVYVSSAYGNGGFTIKLPETVDDAYLSVSDYEGSGITVSNPGVKGTDAFLYAYKSGKVTGCFEYGNIPDNYYGWLTYVDGNVSITGTETDEYGTVNYNLNLKKGWNIVYWHEVSINGKYLEEATTQAPSGMKWYYYEYDENENEWSSPQGSVSKKVPALFAKQKIRQF